MILNVGSARFKLSRTDLGKLVVSFVLSAGAALLMAIADTANLIDWGSATWGPLAGAMVPFLVNFARKLLDDSRAGFEKVRDAREKALGSKVQP